MPGNEANFEVDQEVDQESTSQPSEKNQLEHRDKVVLLAISGLGVGVLLLGYLQLTFNIKSAFKPQNVKPPVDVSSLYAGSLPSILDQELEISDELRTKDTDSDGLSDYDELKVYKTSPYLDDSDSDKILDKQEVLNGTDPNCPEGKTCRQLSQTSRQTEVPQFLAQPPQPSTSFETQLRQAVPIEKLRELLVKQGGLTKEQVDQIDDETLRNIYDQTLQDLNKQNNR